MTKKKTIVQRVQGMRPKTYQNAKSRKTTFSKKTKQGSHNRAILAHRHRQTRYGHLSTNTRSKVYGGPASGMKTGVRNAKIFRLKK